MRLSKHARLCGTCAYFQPNDHEDAREPRAVGTCWRYPPALVAQSRPDGGIGFVARRPPVVAAGFCGEWRDGESGRAAEPHDHGALIREAMEHLRAPDRGAA